MSLRPAELLQVALELNEELSGAFLQKAWAPARRLLYLELRQPGRSTLLLLSAEPELGRLSLASGRLSSEEPAGLQKWVRQELIGGQLQRASAAGRVATLEFLTREGGRSLVLDLDRNALLLLRGERIVAVSTDASPPPYTAGDPWVPPAAAPSADQSRLEPRPGAPLPLAQAAEALYGTVDTQRRLAEAKRRLLQPLKSRKARLLRTLEKVEAEAARTKDAELHRRYGELLAQNLHRLPRGGSRVQLTEYTETGVSELEVPLDPKLPPKEQPEAHFKKYRRYLRGAEHGGKRLQDLRGELAQVEAELRAALALSDDTLLSQPLAQQRSAAPAQQRRTPYRTYLSRGGARILVGKSARDNDALTFKTARPFDLWMHARGTPGSHVIVPLERGAELPQEVLLDAAHLALHHSPRKGEDRGEVAYTYARFVRKVKDGAPGQVLYTREKVFMVRLEPDRLARILAAEAG